MNAEQKQRASQLLKSWTDEEAIGEAFALLQELIDAPEPEPVAYIEHHKGGDNLVWDNPGGKYSVLYSAPPAPSVPDGWKNAAEWLRNNYQDYPNISSLCEAMVAQSANNGSN